MLKIKNLNGEKGLKDPLVLQKVRKQELSFQQSEHGKSEFYPYFWQMY